MFSYSDLDQFPDQIQMIQDTDVPVAANFDTTSEGLANRTRWLKNRRAQWKCQIFTSSGTWTRPNTGTTFVLAFMYGGGGGGAGGWGGDHATTISVPGGGGGGGAIQIARHCDLNATATSITVTVGAGGAGGAGGTGSASPTAGAVGTDGGDSILVDNLSTELARAYGAQGGGAAAIYSDGANMGAGRGGAPVKNTLVSIGAVTGPAIATRSGFDVSDYDYYFTTVPGAGGPGVDNFLNATKVPRGNPSPQGYVGGGATINSDSGTPFGSNAGGSSHGGGPGGGGGGGPGGIGADGGCGGSNGLGVAPDPGNSAAANSGAGGGGGGGGGSNASSSQNGKAGGAGGSGKVILYWIEYGT